MKTGGRFAISTAHGAVSVMNELRALRRTAGLSQKEFASVIGVPFNTFRMWDNGLRAAPVRAQVSVSLRHRMPASTMRTADLRSKLKPRRFHPPRILA